MRTPEERATEALTVFLPAAVLCGALIWLIASGTKIPLFFSLVAIALAGGYFWINFEKTYIPFTLVIVLPLAVFVTSIPNLKACELVVPGLVLLLGAHTLVSQVKGPGFKILPVSVILFFVLGAVSFLRNPSLPTQVFARSVDMGNFRNYWNFFMGLATYLLAFHLFRKDRERKLMVTVRCLTGIYVGGLLLHLAMTYLGVVAPAGFFLVDWGPAPESGSTGTVFRGWTFGWYGLHLFLILIAFPGFPRNRFLKSFFFLLAGACIILSGARATLLAAAFCAIFAGVLRKKFLALILPLTAVTVILVISYAFPRVISSLPAATQRIFTIFPSSDVYGHREAVVSARTRLYWWNEAFDIISRHPFAGIGFERVGRKSLYLAYSEYAVEIGGSHSAYIATGVMLGIPGTVLLLWIFALHLQRGVRLFRGTDSAQERNANLWLTVVLVSFNVIFLFAGSPQHLFRYFLYAGMINLNWYAATREPVGEPFPEKNSR
ncbi:MAG TPA: O-antigen ligase family protein [bacterium]|nr:O-antigen ligase family protein [bacterium]HPJ71882.1 O-antigen ligase family protein [bacterium]HPQ65375.1 O-antigen ligase family protein [bacterium]